MAEISPTSIRAPPPIPPHFLIAFTILIDSTNSEFCRMVRALPFESAEIHLKENAL